jgi:hypothetical protein
MFLSQFFKRLGLPFTQAGGAMAGRAGPVCETRYTTASQATVTMVT